MESPLLASRLEDQMSRTDDRADKALPVTGEVGSEGGSYADPTNQVAAFEGELKEVGSEAPAVEPDPSDTETVDSKKYPKD